MAPSPECYDDHDPRSVPIDAFIDWAEGILRSDESFMQQVETGKLLVDLLHFRELIEGVK